MPPSALTSTANVGAVPVPVLGAASEVEVLRLRREANDLQNKMNDAAPGQSGFINQNGKPDAHFADQLSLFESYKCKDDAVSQKEIDQSTQQSITLNY